MANDQESIDGLEPNDTDESNKSDDTQIEGDQESEGSNKKRFDFKGIQRVIPKSRRVIIIAGAVLSSTILIGAILFFVGYFDSEPVIPPAKDTKEVKKASTATTAMTPKKKIYTFKVKDIDKKRLNRKLALLTKDELIEEEKPEEKIVLIKTKEIEIKEEPKKIEPEKTEVKKQSTVIIKEEIVYVKKPSLREIEKNKTVEDENEKVSQDTAQENNKVEEPVAEPEVAIETKEEIKEIVEEIVDEIVDDVVVDVVVDVVDEPNLEEETKKTDEIEEVIDDEPIVSIDEEKLEEDQTETTNEESMDTTTNEEIDSGKSFLKLIQVATIKQTLYLSYLNKVNKIDKRISVCRNNDNDIQVFIGPFQNSAERKIVLDGIHTQIAQDAFIVDFTQKEFDNRCEL